MTLLILFGPHIKCVFVRFITWADLIKAAKKEKKTPNSFRVRVSIALGTNMCCIQCLCVIWSIWLKAKIFSSSLLNLKMYIINHIHFQDSLDVFWYDLGLHNENSKTKVTQRFSQTLTPIAVRRLHHSNGKWRVQSLGSISVRIPVRWEKFPSFIVVYLYVGVTQQTLLGVKKVSDLYWC